MLCACRQQPVSAAVHVHWETYPWFRIRQLPMRGCNQLLIHICAMWDVRFLLVMHCGPLPRKHHSYSTEHAAICSRALSPAQSKGRRVHRSGGPCGRGGLHGPEILRLSRLSDRGGRAAALARFRAAQGAPTGRIGSRQQLAGGVFWGCSGGAQWSYGDHLHPIQLRFHGKPLF